jgi:protease II
LAFIADPVTPGSLELFTTDGSSRRRLSGSLAAFTEVKQFEWAPDSSLVAFTSDKDTIGNFKLFTSAPDTTDKPDVRSDPLSVSSSQVFDFAWAPDSERIAYTSNANFINRTELFTTVASPGASREIRAVSELLVDGREVVEFAWDPINSARIAYTADQDTDDVTELYTTLPDVDFDSVKVSGPIIPADGDVGSFAWNPFDASRIAYLADSSVDGVVELFTTEPDDDLNVVKLHDDLPVGRSVEDFAWASDGSRIAYMADQDSDDVTELFTSTPDSKLNNVKISGTLVLFGNVTSFLWAPDSSRVAYRADQDTQTVFELYTSLPNTNTGNKKVSGEMQASGSVESDFKWAGDTSGLGYVADQISDEVFELFESLPDGSKNKKISGTLAEDGDVFEFDFVPD